jgi:DtxR family transcriptional regulator, manganese transport regulator
MNMHRGIAAVPRLKLKLLEPSAQAEGFGRIREDHRAEIAEDYVELIADLIQARGEARAVDLAERLGVTNATVANTVAKLQRDGLVTSEPYRSIFLTDKGADLARHCKRRHQIVVSLLEAVGVSAETAHRDAEGIEHHVSDETLDAFARFVERRTGPSSG